MARKLLPVLATSTILIAVQVGGGDAERAAGRVVEHRRREHAVAAVEQDADSPGAVGEPVRGDAGHGHHQIGIAVAVEVRGGHVVRFVGPQARLVARGEGAGATVDENLERARR